MSSNVVDGSGAYVRHLYAAAEAAADRAEMHAIIGQQRDNWNHLLLSSINSMNLSAAVMAGVCAARPEQFLAFKVSAALLYAAAAAMMAAVNTVQPSQLAEEQRSAVRLFRQLERSVYTELAVGDPPEEDDVKEAIARVLALDRAYPLSLMPGMLDKFPKKVEPTTWWPRINRRREKQLETATGEAAGANGWSKELEEEMKGVLQVLRKKDEEQYITVGKLALGVSRALAVSGPVFAGLAAIGVALIGSPALGPWPGLVAAVGGALAAVTNAAEHGGQVGMLFELFRNLAGYYRQLEEAIEANLAERDAARRDNGELFETQMALRLGRSPTELKEFAAHVRTAKETSSSSLLSSSSPPPPRGEEEEGNGGGEEFAGKLF
ncbi:putative F-box protein [Ananas comosus]|uniref:Putative F-box protein n=1 Tax=Ananas comosus TaxID=4615 RepID=A0A199VEM8_ANACO|nr:putative F-box protein [Ananas comosus]